MRIMIGGGGTGGHTSPALAILEEFQRRDPQLVVQWVGRKGRIEEGVCRDRGIPFRSVPVEGWPRRRSIRKAWAAGKLACGIMKAWMLVRRFRPQAVVGVGGYVSLPLVYAAQRRGVPTFLHEQNQFVGMANRILAQRARRLFLSFPDTSGDYPKDRSVVVGNPVRAGFAHPPSRERVRDNLGLDQSIPVVLVVGGSRGAHRINRAMSDALPHFGEEEAQFLWMTGPEEAGASREVAHKARAHTGVFAYIDDMVAACAAADVIISRAGASTSAEIAAIGRPAILVPYPHATDNHQEKNARAFVERGAALLVRDADCDGAALLGMLRDLLADPDRLERMGKAATSLAHPGAAERIVEEILSLVFDAPNG